MEAAFSEVERLALDLNTRNRGRPAGVLLRSLPSPDDADCDDGDGIEVARRRRDELTEHPEMEISHEEFLASLKTA